MDILEFVMHSRKIIYNNDTYKYNIHVSQFEKTQKSQILITHRPTRHP